MKRSDPIPGIGSNMNPRTGSIFEAIIVGLASLIALLIIIVFAVWVAKLVAIDDAHQRADLIASKAARAVTSGLHADPVIDAPSAFNGDTSLFDRIDEAIYGHPNIRRIRRFSFVGDVPVELIDPRKPTDAQPANLADDIIDRLLAGVQFVTHTGDSWFDAPEVITAYAPVYDRHGDMYGAVAVDLEPVVLNARLDLLRLAAGFATIFSVIFSGLLGLRVVVSRRIAEISARELDHARKLEALSIEALGELLYSMECVSGQIIWHGSSRDRFAGKLFNPPDTLVAWLQCIHPDDRNSFVENLKAVSEEGDKFLMEYRLVLPVHGNPILWVIDRSTITRDSGGKLILIGAIVDITARKSSDNQLREFINQTPTAQFVFDGDEIISANPAAVEMVVADSSSALADMPLWTLWPKLQPDGTISAEAWSRHVIAAIENGTQHFEWLFLRLDGKTLFVDVFLKSAILESRQVILMACHDLTKSKQTQMMLEESERRFRDVTESVGEFVWEVGKEGNYTYVSPRVKEILGVAPDVAMGRSPFDWVHPDDRELVLNRSIEITHTRCAFRDFIHRIRRADGTVRWIRVSGVPRFDASGELMGFRGISLDITQQREYEDELLLQKEAAEAADRAKSSFLAMMSHEIRTPLNSVLGFTDILLESSLTDSQRESLQTIRSSGDALLHILNDILDFSKIESDNMDIEPQPTNVRACLADSIELQRPGAVFKGLTLNSYVDSAIPEWMVCDPIRLKQILLNLLSNAIKFTVQGEVNVRAIIQTQPVKTASEPPTQLHIQVQDAGVGIRHEQLDRLFKPFSQADSSTNRQFGGTGLGLVISRRLARLMGGDLVLESTSDLGTIFSVRLPILVTEAPLVDEPVSPVVKITFPETKILVVDDNAINLRLTQRIIGQFGAQVQTARSGQECIDLLAHHDFDVILMDVQMPGMDGHETTRLIRSMEDARGLTRVPIIALTAGAMRGDRERCLEAGMDEYLTKPIRRESLAAVLEKIIHRRSKQ